MHQLDQCMYCNCIAIGYLVYLEMNHLSMSRLTFQARTDIRRNQAYSRLDWDKFCHFSQKFLNWSEKWIYFLIFFSCYFFFSVNHGVWSVYQWNTSSWNRYETKSGIFKILCILEQSYCHRFDSLFHDSDFEFFYSHQDCQIDKIQGKNTSSKKYASRGKLWCNIIMQLCLIPSEYFQCFIISYLNENEKFCWNQSAKKLKYSHHSLEIVTVQGPFDYRWTV